MNNPDPQEPVKKALASELHGALDQYLKNAISWEQAQAAIVRAARPWIIGALVGGLLIGVAVGAAIWRHHS